MRVAVIVFILFFVSSAGWAKTYEWVDEKGTVNFSQDYNSIPEKYRDQVKEKPDEPAGETKTKEKSEKTLKASPGKESHKGSHKASPKGSGKGHEERQQVSKNRIEADAADGLQAIVSLWKDEKYEALYEYGTDSSKTSMSRERFVQGMRKKSWGIASSWEGLQSIEPRFKSPTVVYVTAKIGQRSRLGGNTKTLNETYPMKLERGIWKTDLSKILGASQHKQNKKKKAARSH